MWPLAGLPRAPFEITPEQEIRRVCRDFAANQIRPVRWETNEADTPVPIGSSPTAGRASAPPSSASLLTRLTARGRLRQTQASAPPSTAIVVPVA
jgi:hypothetical protein